MEDTARTWRAFESGRLPSAHALPSLVELVALFERGAEDKSTVSALRLLEEVIPSLGFQMDSASVEEAFAGIRGQERLSLLEFAQWLGDLYVAAEIEERQAMEEAQLSEVQA